MKKLLMRVLILTSVSGVAALAGGAHYSWAEEVSRPLKTISAGDLGKILTGPNGMTLYIFTMDTEGRSVCKGPCAKRWPPFRPEASAPAPKVPLSIITRDDGTKQYSYKGQPLYYWWEDKKPGDTTGHRVGGVWFIVKP